MKQWTAWVEVEKARSRNGRLDDYGIYQIRAVDRKGKPIPIRRIVGIDYGGLVYVGRSGFRSGGNRRTVSNRIREFEAQRHSGGITYARARKVLWREPRFSGHRLQVRARFLSDRDIERTESKVLAAYFNRHAELPPCNSQSGKRKGS